ncbi:acyl-CoA dehydrogenase [Streptomyces pharetrae]|uniref:acyl-CoA dehydrogenase n=1 Tax=Streptomyces pharetrae TaxID=291370 RepID=UPI00335195DA
MSETTLSRAVGAPAPVPGDAGAPARTTWAELGAADRIRAAYRDGRPERGVAVEALGELLTELDADRPAGVVLSACVQLATALPLLAETVPRHEALHDGLAGRAVIALAATDSGSGSDLTGAQTTVRRDGSEAEINGTKRWITNATTADWLLVLARRRAGPHFTNFDWVLVAADTPGVRVEPADTDLFTGSGVGHVHLDGVRVGSDALIGGSGRGLPLFLRHIAVERLAGGLWATAVCRRVLSATRRWLVGREPLWEREGVRLDYARALVRARQLDALVGSLGRRIAERHDQAAAALVKASAGTTVEEVVAACAHLYGAEGFTSAGLQRQRAEASLFGIAGGPTEVVLSAVADRAEVLLRDFGPEGPW